MSHRIYTPEFTDEAVRQVVERGSSETLSTHRVQTTPCRPMASAIVRKHWTLRSLLCAHQTTGR